jgi:hypothetical protein
MISWMLKPDVSLSILSPEEVEEGIDVVFVARFRPSMPSSIRSIMYGKKGLDEARAKNPSSQSERYLHREARWSRDECQNLPMDRAAG